MCEAALLGFSLETSKTAGDNFLTLRRCSANSQTSEVLKIPTVQGWG